MDDYISLAAYIIILLIIGLASVFKKIMEETKKRRQRQLQPERPLPGYSGGLRPDDAPKDMTERSEEIAPGKPQPKPELTESPKESEVDIDIEEVLRRIMGVPEREPPPPRRIRKRVKKAPPVAAPSPPLPKKEQPVKPVLKKVTTPLEKVPIRSDWTGFIRQLEAKGLSELQKAIIMREILNPPVALRGGRQFWYR